MTIDYPPDPVGERQAQRWFKASDPAAYVGSRHHTVPGFFLRRFAADGKRLLIWRRVTDQVQPGSVNGLSVTDFYTVLTTDGEFDGRMEDVLGMVEDDAAPVINLLLSSAFRRPGPLTDDQRSSICKLVAFQRFRGPRKRREIELLADYGWKMLGSGQLTQRDLREVTVVSHPNDHVRLMGPISYAMYRNLMLRPVQLIKLDAPLLVTCDEPVIVDIDEHVQHRAECFMTESQLRRLRRDRKDGIFEQPFHIWPTQPSGVETAEAVGMPQSPSALLVFGRIGDHIQSEVVVRGDEAGELAESVNAALASQAYDWIAARPDHPTFAEWSFPPPSPLLGVCDGGSIMSEQLKSAPVHRWQRIRKNWPGSR
jgi:hypothetical protein